MAWVMPSVTVAFACTSVIARALAPADATAGDTRLLAMVFAVIEDTEALHRKKGRCTVWRSGQTSSQSMATRTDCGERAEAYVLLRKPPQG